MSEESSSSARASLGDEHTLLVSRRVRPGRTDDVTRWLVQMIDLAERFPGSLGTAVIAPSGTGSSVYRLVFRFADGDTLAAFERSDERHALSTEADAFSSATRAVYTGMEAWFEDGVADTPEPPKWKMAAVTFVVVYVVTAVLIPLEEAWLPRSWSFFAVNVVTNVVIAGLMTWVIMPVVARVLRGWLYR